MPELPEVETVCRTLSPLVIGKKIIAIEIYESKCIKNSTLEDFKNKLVNQTFCDVKRRGKHIIFILDDYVLISHLRMEGKYYYSLDDHDINMKHVLLTFFLNDKHSLNYHDTRRFGTFHLFTISDYTNSNPIKKLGYEPFDANLTAEILFKNWFKRKKPMKSLLLEQNIITGIGNIYADEILFASNIHPLTLGTQINLKDCEKILQASKVVLQKAINLGGTTISSYTSQMGVHGKFQNSLNVYHHHKQACYVCNTVIQQIKIGGRSTHFCPNCQRSKKGFN